MKKQKNGPGGGVTENRVEKILYNQFSLAVAFVGLVLATVGWLKAPQERNAEAVVILKEQVNEQRLEAKANKDLFDQLVKTQQNDLHTVEGTLKEQNDNLDILKNEVIKVQTILQERLPPKR